METTHSVALIVSLTAIAEALRNTSVSRDAAARQVDKVIAYVVEAAVSE